LQSEEIPSNILNDISVLLPEYVALLLLHNYNYIVSEFYQLPEFIMAEGFIIH
ncbi:11415_t:CDS:1, partial [Cetraspora pellucida]